jgi:hypothetical protein
MNKLAIMGLGESKIEYPANDPSWDFWGLNNLYKVMPQIRWDRYFEIHRFSIRHDNVLLRKGESEFRGMTIDEYLRDLNNLNVIVYMNEECQTLLSNSMPLPKRSLVDKYGRYFTSTHAWMLAMAIEREYSTIGLFGVDMSDPDHIDKRTCFEHYLGIAKAKGIDIVIPASCPLLKSSTLYGFES